MELVEAVRSCIAAHVRPGENILVGVSGGPDSCALVHALATVQSVCGVGIRAAHVHHSMRGAEADADAAFVEDFCARLNVPCEVRRCDAAGAARRMHASAQEAARTLRLHLLRDAATAARASWIALGHTLDDHLETVLMNILRGTGIEGLAGIRTVDAPFIRPLRAVRRQDTVAYCKRHGIAFREDASNASFRYLRNRVRSELLPMLAAYYNPAVAESIERLSRLAAEESAYLDAQARKALEAATVNAEPGRLVLAQSALASSPAAVRRRMIREAIRVVRGNLHGVEYRHIEQVSRAVEEVGAAGSRAWTLPAGSTTVRVCGATLVVERCAPPSDAARRWWELALPGHTPVPELGITVQARYATVAEEPVGQSAARAVLNAGDLALPLKVRTRRPGDRMRPLGLGGSKKVQDLMVDAKIPRKDRDKIPIIVDDRGILWVVGCALDERARVTSGSAGAVVVEVRGIAGG
ncbi:MAG: tRNA lysidine(34) synthetase TilS [Chthonomonadales bacterium]